MLAHASAAPPAVAGDIDSSIDDLNRAIVTLAARLNAVTHDFLILVRRFDERAGWLAWGFESCADWLHWRCDLSLSAAREAALRGDVDIPCHRQSFFYWKSLRRPNMLWRSCRTSHRVPRVTTVRNCP